MKFMDNWSNGGLSKSIDVVCTYRLSLCHHLYKNCIASTTYLTFPYMSFKHEWVQVKIKKYRLKLLGRLLLSSHNAHRHRFMAVWVTLFNRMSRGFLKMIVHYTRKSIYTWHCIANIMAYIFNEGSDEVAFSLALSKHLIKGTAITNYKKLMHQHSYIAFTIYSVQWRCMYGDPTNRPMTLL